MRRYSLFSLLAVVVLSAACTPAPTAQLETNKDLVRQFTAATNAADWETLATIVREDFARHSAATAGPPVTSRDQFVQLQETFLVGIPDQHVTIEQLVAEGDFVAARMSYAGTHTGPMGEIPATGRTVEVPFQAMFRIADGTIAELWVEWDNVAMLTQLGLFPPPPPPSN